MCLTAVYCFIEVIASITSGVCVLTHGVLTAAVLRN